ncbi:leucine-rich repeat-containing protein 24-like [Teleopsis dalmanni]|uniref:leucine-rich repeat-containing protein 24-like n=1 Tax=Teleopsis dalmanni TaxID=139649 RepID=UPI0018CC8AF6|nr:leucine-rich repeat-containing protein 24-like [Teleopsis dalmanni]
MKISSCTHHQHKRQAAQKQQQQQQEEQEEKTQRNSILQRNQKVEHKQEKRCNATVVIIKTARSTQTITTATHSLRSFRSRKLTYLLCHMLLLLLSLIEPTHGDWLMDCGDCHCKWNSGKKTADCKNLSLSSVPENLNTEVQVLDLSFNRIPFLEENAFMNAQLLNLHKLYIRNSSLQQIDPRTFTQLEILIELDVSNNLLRSLQANLFARLVKVRALVLNGNLLESLSDGIFQNLKYLHKIELKDNRLTRISTQVFINVPLLSQIYLNGNRLSFLRKESFESVKRLTALSLDQNPWNCTCELQIFRDFVLKRNLYTPPTACYFPVHLRGMLWVEDQPEAFACKPKIIYPARGASINTSKENVTLVCRVHASPNTHISWDYNKQMYRSNAVNSAQQQRVHIQLLRDEQSKEKEFGRDVFISRLTIIGADKNDEGIYTCLAENAGGKDVVQMNLLIQKPGSKDLLLQGNLVIVICLMALGLLSVSVLLALITCCIYKRFKHINSAHRHHHHHHLDVADQLTTGLEHTTTTVTGGTDVVLGVSVDETSTGNFKHHLQKTNLNGGTGGMDKYSEMIKHGVSVMDNGFVNVGADGVEHHKLLLNDAKTGHAEKAYLERSTKVHLLKWDNFEELIDSTFSPSWLSLQSLRVKMR